MGGVNQGCCSTRSHIGGTGVILLRAVSITLPLPQVAGNLDELAMPIEGLHEEVVVTRHWDMRASQRIGSHLVRPGGGCTGPIIPLEEVLGVVIAPEEGRIP